MTEPVIDAHVHLWDLDRFRYPWLDDLPVINRTFLLRDFDAARGAREVEAIVFVQAECRPDQFRDELRWVQSLADQDRRLRGIVPWAPLEFGPKVETDLELMAHDPRVKGIRRIIQFEDDHDFCLRPDFITGVRLLANFGLHFELTVAPRHMPQVMRMVEACPETRFILDHVGNPSIAFGEIEPWRTYIREFAASGPHRCKLSNLVCNADLQHWTPRDLAPYAEAVIEAFSPDRVIWAGDWPHALRASGYLRWLETAEALTAFLGEDDRRRIFHDNAVAFYRLDARV